MFEKLSEWRLKAEMQLVSASPLKKVLVLVAAVLAVRMLAGLMGWA